ncbi:hypothetical protein HO133_008418 [Letharia lupina]|uniref:Aminoacyl-transfer RNA synthetases class-II family profile domain-containing protein n=1 Tax=Letharia lupina TaxID=560253 RepID=A0A8H6CP28_9LECA|nr:uncharacterized protein HO133_008418 [Letharia lupina]KAF6226977.1 hypothetical protein HO133_008418 [Letharia lupina]
MSLAARVFLSSSRECSEYVTGSPGREVVLHGYLGPRSDLSKKLSFVTLFDTAYKKRVQIVATPYFPREGDQDVHEKLKSIKANTPVALRGFFGPKPGNRQSPSSKSTWTLDDFELKLCDITSLNDLPSDFIVTPDSEFSPEQRHLQIRTNQHISGALGLRGDIAYLCREIFHSKLGFLEVETPLLFKSTSEGAREFIVPTRRKGLAYALPQSPQQFKQILMASGIREYFQFARCFRDEDLRADRQPEFTQLDIEKSFAEADDVIAVVEELIRTVWKRFLDVELPKPFPRMTYTQAMSRYGSDKPDLRIPIQPFSRIDHLLPADLVGKITSLMKPIVEVMIIPGEGPTETIRGFIRGFLDSPDNKQFLDNPAGGPGIFIYDSGKPLQGLSAFGFEAVEELERMFGLQDGCIVILQARENAPLSGGSTALGDMRNAIYKALTTLSPPGWKDFSPVWITDFPLFSPSNSSEPGQGGNAGLASTHHPFTSPKTARDVDLLLTDPSQVIGDHYDLVINGEEIGGGSRRIHHAEMQEFVMRDILKMDNERVAEFSHLLEALRSGCPPHAGIALGFDRLVAMIHASRTEKKTTLRDVIAFPKSGKGDDLMVKSPGPMTEDDLQTYHLKLRE